MKKLIVLLPLMVMIWACSGGESNNSKSKKEKKVAKADAPDGKKIFKINCVLCHGSDGKLGVNGSKDLTKSEISLNEAITQITNGKGLMAAYEPILTKEEIKAVAEYTISLRE